MNQYFQVNWVNGMKITSGHFVELENHFIHRIQNSFKGVVSDLSYGLFPGGEKDRNIPQFSVSFSENKIKLFNNLSALSSDGYFIQLPAGLEFNIAKPISEALSYYLVISIKPFERIPYGMIDEQESPLRFPEAIPEYQFQLLPPNGNAVHSFGGCIIPIGKYIGSSFEEDKSYIPPCTSVQSHPVLLESYSALSVTFNDLEKKILELLNEQNIPNRMMLVNLINFFNENKPAFDWYIPHQPPVFMFEKVSKVARIIYYSSEIQKAQLKDELKSLLRGIMNFKYDHLEISKAVANAKLFTDNYLKFLPKQDNVFGV